MINGFLAAFVALFFWRKGTKETEEKTRRASKLRTFIYCILTIVVGIFFYKTYQVASIINSITVVPIRASYDSTGVIADTIPKIEILNRFSSSLSYNNIVLDQLKENTQDWTYYKYGGVSLEVNTHNPPFLIKDNPNIPNNAIEILGSPVKNPDHYYSIIIASTGINSIIPFFPDINYNMDWKQIDFDVFARLRLGNLKDGDLYLFNPTSDNSSSYELSEQDTKINTEGYFFQQDFVSSFTIEPENPYSIIHACAKSSFSNTLGFFTAADISQYTHMISIQTDCYVSSLNMEYDIPIEITAQDSCISVGSHKFVVTAPLLEKMKNHTLVFHVKLPTMANLQLIRSLILTTLITALISLFFTNFYYLIRKGAIGYRKKHTLPYSKAKLISRKKIKWFRFIMYTITVTIFLIMLWMSFLVFTDSPIYIPIQYGGYLIFIFIGLIILLAIIITLLYLYARKPVSNEKNKMDNNNDKMVEQMTDNSSQDHDESNNEEMLSDPLDT